MSINSTLPYVAPVEINLILQPNHEIRDRPQKKMVYNAHAQPTTQAKSHTLFSYSINTAVVKYKFHT